MTVARRLQQNVAQARAGPEERIVRDAHLLGDLVGRLETDAMNVLGQRIRIGLNLFNCILRRRSCKSAPPGSC